MTLRIAQRGWALAAVFLFLEGISIHAAESSPALLFTNLWDPKGPWAVQLVRVPRKDKSFQIESFHAYKKAVGCAPVSLLTTQAKSETLTPIAAINGDFYERGGAYFGDPRGLQIVFGEMLSAPAGTPSFWMDAAGEPHLAVTYPAIQVTLPGGAPINAGLNGRRAPSAFEIYTSAVGETTRTGGGREVILEAAAEGDWLPLRPGKLCEAKVRSIVERGNCPIPTNTVVLSIGPGKVRSVPALQPGDKVKLLASGTPSITGARTALSGGPILLHNGRTQRFSADTDTFETSSMYERHPRSAIGWNDDYFFLIEVDGRQRGWSIGMTLEELASFLSRLGCKEALNLDGGGSATLWYGGRVRNRPCDGRERPVANGLIVMKKAG